MIDIEVFDRASKRVVREQVYGDAALRFVYGDTLFARVFGRPLLFLLLRTAFVSRLFGWWQKSRFSKKKVMPFIEKFEVDTAEFLRPPEAFATFNDFFVRELRPESRPLSPNPAIIPADGRYRFIPNIQQSDGFIVKGQKFRLDTLLQDPQLAKEYESGTLVMARLCPTDYHRFHFPADATAGEANLVNGWLYSVNPIATKRNIHIFSENKRMITPLQSEQFGRILYIEVGATCVGSIEQTYQPNRKVKKGEEKGLFAFGASALLLLFPPDSIQIDADLLEASKEKREIRCLLGQSLGKPS